MAARQHALCPVAVVACPHSIPAGVEPIEWTPGSPSAAWQPMRLDPGRLEVLRPPSLRDSAHVRALVEPRRRQRVATRLAPGGLGDLRLPHSRLHCPLQRQRRSMVPPCDVTAGVERALERWQDLWPAPIGRGRGGLPLQSIRHRDTPAACLSIARRRCCTSWRCCAC
jgi:hypothetical protein